jgi:hypothetical protein
MTKVEWGRLYAEYGNKDLNVDYINQRVDALMADSEVTANSKVYEYVLLGEPLDKQSMLVLRNFYDRDKEIQAKKQKGRDPISGDVLGKDGMKTHAHHIIPWSRGGKTELDNLIVINEDTHKRIHMGEISCEVVQKKLKDYLETYCK